MQPMEQYISESHSESESDPKEEDRKELVSKRSCISDELVSKQAQKKQKVSVTDPKSEEAMKLVNEMYFTMCKQCSQKITLIILFLHAYEQI
jgi:hypothetical protein